MQKKYSILWYTKEKVRFPKMSFVQHDTETNKISFEMYDDIDVPMSNISYATATVQRSDGKTYTYGTDAFEITDNIVTFILPPSAVYVAGKQNASISVYGTSGTDEARITTPTFSYDVTEELVSDTPIDETNDYPVLTELIDRTETLKEAYQGAIDGSSEAQAYIAVEDAKGTFDTLQHRLDDEDVKLTNITNRSGWIFDSKLVDDNNDYIVNTNEGCWINSNYNLAEKLNFSRLNVKENRHVGLSSAAYIRNGEFHVLTREAQQHANDTSGKITLYKDKTGGKSLGQTPYVTVQDTANADDRDFSFGFMGNGRLGVISARNFANMPPVFSYSDNNGETWTNLVISNAPNNLSCLFGIHKYPASVGGDDTNGYIAYGWIEGTWDGIYAMYTKDNGTTWTCKLIISDAGVQPSEVTVCRIGKANKWLMVYRENASAALPMRIATSVDMINWTVPVNGQIIGQNPPYLYYYKGFVYLFVSVRTQTTIAGNSNRLMYVRTTAEKIYNNDFSDFNVFKEIKYFDNLLGYFQLTESDQGHLYGSIAYAQVDSPYYTGQESKIALITTEPLEYDQYQVRNTTMSTNGVTFRIYKDRLSGRCEIMFEATATYADATCLAVTVTLPFTFGNIWTVLPSYKSVTTSTTGTAKLGIMRADIISNNQVKLNLWTASTGNFATSDTAVIRCTVVGEYFN